jgi:hypothetical protein
MRMQRFHKLGEHDGSAAQAESGDEMTDVHKR